MKRGTIEHPKTEMLAELLGIELGYAVGILEALFHFTSKYARRGNIGSWDNKTIAKRCLWSGDPDKLIDALINARGGKQHGFLERHSEYRLIVHDWKDHCDDATKKAVLRAKEDFVRPDQGMADNGGQRRTESDKVCLPEPEPEPSQALPSPAQPQRDQTPLGALIACRVGEPALSTLAGAVGISAGLVWSEWDQVQTARDPPAALVTRLSTKLKTPIPKAKTLSADLQRLTNLIAQRTA